MLLPDRNILVTGASSGIGLAEEQAQAAAWLLSDRASFVTGEELVVDGGRTVR